ncbi:MAG TPA: hypothetical protein VKQ54_04300, partial [Caulobacteraceae bacterium]|nr:hypothetical protein [Caulobacteraceae bacterium]
PARAMAPPAPLIDQAAQGLKEFRHAVDFVENDETVFITAQEQFGVGELASVSCRLQVKIERVPPAGDLVRQRCLSNLPRSDDAGGSLAL